jgi:hypothetical protein
MTLTNTCFISNTSYSSAAGRASPGQEGASEFTSNRPSAAAAAVAADYISTYSDGDRHRFHGQRGFTRGGDPYANAPRGLDRRWLMHRANTATAGCLPVPAC